MYQLGRCATALEAITVHGPNLNKSITVYLSGNTISNGRLTLDFVCISRDLVGGVFSLSGRAESAGATVLTTQLFCLDLHEFFLERFCRRLKKASTSSSFNPRYSSGLSNDKRSGLSLQGMA